MKRRPAIAVFVKTPDLSPVKTRLAASLGPIAASAFYRLSCSAIEQTLKEISGEWDCYWAIAEPRSALHKNVWPTFALIDQGEGGLGDRLGKVYNELLDQHSAVLLIGADAPQIKSKHFEEAGDLLKENCFVMGSAQDGGFYLFGGHLPIPCEVWTSVHYSTEHTALELKERLRPLAAVVTLSEQLRDVDDEAALNALAEHLQRSFPHEGQRAIVEWFRTLKEPLPS